MLGQRLPGERAGTVRGRRRAPLRHGLARQGAVRALAAVAACWLALLALAPAASASPTHSLAEAGQAGVSLPVWPVAIVGSLLIVAGALALGAAAFVWPRRRR
jgi:hypothetical protein